jgi:hypothetical protein
MKAAVSIPVGVVVERQKADSKWIDYTWRPVSVLHGQPAAAAWTVLNESGDAVTFFAGVAYVELHPAETANYRDNLSTGDPRLWVVLRPTGVDPPYDVACVTADGSEGEGYFSTGEDIVESVPMPDGVWDAIDAFIAQHHVDRPFVKRKRNRANPEALGRHGIVDENKK